MPVDGDRVVLLIDDSAARDGWLRALSHGLQESTLAYVPFAGDTDQRGQVSTLAADADVVLLDLCLPKAVGETPCEEEGLKVLKALVGDDPARPKIPVVVLSADDDVVWARRCIEHGARGYFSKTGDALPLGPGREELDATFFTAYHRKLHQLVDLEDRHWGSVGLQRLARRLGRSNRYRAFPTMEWFSDLSPALKALADPMGLAGTLHATLDLVASLGWLDEAPQARALYRRVCPGPISTVVAESVLALCGLAERLLRLVLYRFDRRVARATLPRLLTCLDHHKNQLPYAAQALDPGWDLQEIRNQTFYNNEPQTDAISPDVDPIPLARRLISPLVCELTPFETTGSFAYELEQALDPRTAEESWQKRLAAKRKRATTQRDERARWMHACQALAEARRTCRELEQQALAKRQDLERVSEQQTRLYSTSRATSSAREQVEAKVDAASTALQEVEHRLLGAMVAVDELAVDFDTRWRTYAAALEAPHSTANERHACWRWRVVSEWLEERAIEEASARRLNEDARPCTWPGEPSSEELQQLIDNHSSTLDIDTLANQIRAWADGAAR